MYVLVGNFSSNWNASVLSPLTLNVFANMDTIRQTKGVPLAPTPTLKTNKDSQLQTKL